MQTPRARCVTVCPRRSRPDRSRTYMPIIIIFERRIFRAQRYISYNRRDLQWTMPDSLIAWVNARESGPARRSPAHAAAPPALRPRGSRDRAAPAAAPRPRARRRHIRLTRRIGEPHRGRIQYTMGQGCHTRAGDERDREITDYLTVTCSACSTPNCTRSHSAPTVWTCHVTGYRAFHVVSSHRTKICEKFVAHVSRHGT